MENLTESIAKIYIQGRIDKNTASSVIDQLDIINNSNIKSVFLYIDSEGGSIISTLSIVDAMNISPKRIITLNCGLAASGASLILANGRKGFRWSYLNSNVMLHDGYFELQGHVEDLNIEYNFALQKNDQFIYSLSKATGITFKNLKSKLNRDLYLTSKEALTYNIIDKIVTKKNLKEFYKQ